MTAFENRFSDDASCLDYLVEIRWPNGGLCVHCGSGKLWRSGQLYVCGHCKGHTRIMAGTIFQDTHLPLQLWFRAIWWVVTQKNGTSALGLKRVLGLSYKTTWSLLHKIRRAMVRPERSRLSGRIEVDEVYVGGLEEGVHGRQPPQKRWFSLRCKKMGRKWGASECGG